MFSGMFKRVVDMSGTEPVVEVAQAKVWTPPPEQATKSLNIDKGGHEGRQVQAIWRASVTSAKAIAKAFTPEMATVPPAKTLFLGKASPIHRKWPSPELRGILISACKEDETAAASTSKTNGMSAFTHSLLKAVNSLGSSRAASDIFNATEQSLTARRFSTNAAHPRSKHAGRPSGGAVFLRLSFLTGLESPNLRALWIRICWCPFWWIVRHSPATTKEFQPPTVGAATTEKFLGIVLPMITAIVPAIIDWPD